MCLVCLQCLHGFLGDYTDSEKPMIIMAYFPFDQQVHYKTALLIQTIFLAIAALYYCLTQVTYITAVTYVKMELKLLQYQFREFDRFKMIYNIVDDEVMMIKLIRRHQFIIGFTAEVNKFLRPILLVEFLLSSVNISFVVLQLISSETNMPLPFTLNYFVILIAQLLILAWHANEISIESLGISSAVWEQPWYEKSVKIQKMMYMVVCRSHKPLTLTIGPFGNLTTQTVINVINAAYSYVTIMRHNDS
ncbi:odorant receptor 30a-like isoform X2 [Anthonomus grandis grandis]|uniref:odorant receptor 30a-like isoform X2 n=1 Tax=Anthonomus grandis grandis TaxID=2921223 RepID=UPI002166BA9B|nr:odorant receptor 30a-like isoform X2 [Anthonomus grandis grandis]